MKRYSCQGALKSTDFSNSRMSSAGLRVVFEEFEIPSCSRSVFPVQIYNSLFDSILMQYYKLVVIGLRSGRVNEEFALGCFADLVGDLR